MHDFKKSADAMIEAIRSVPAKLKHFIASLKRKQYQAGYNWAMHVLSTYKCTPDGLMHTIKENPFFSSYNKGVADACQFRKKTDRGLGPNVRRK